MYPFIYIGSISLPSYGVMCALGVIAALVFSMFFVHKAQLRMDIALVLFTGALAFGLIGALLWYTFVTYSINDLYRLITGGAFFQEFEFGFVYYGGFLFGFASAFLLSKLLRFPLAPYARQMLPSLPLAHAFGRIGCFLAGCCYGVESRLFGICYPVSNSVSFVPKGIPLLPVQLIESFLLIVIAIVLARISQKSKLNILKAYILAYAPVRFTLEFFRGDAIRGFVMGLSTSQWISLFLIILALLPVKSRLKG